MAINTRDQVLPDNPLKNYTSYSTYFTIKIGRAYRTQLKPNQFGERQLGAQREIISNITPDGHARPENILLLDTRGQDLDATGQAQRPNPHPQLTVKHFDVMHFFTFAAEVTFGLDSTLRIFERGSAAYIQELGRIMLELGVSSTAELVMWVGVGIWGWENGDSGAQSGWEATPVSQHWFPFHIFKVDVNIKNSGAEYTHWLKGWNYHRSTDRQSQHINNISTTGITLNDHILDLMSKAKTGALKTKEELTRVSEDDPINQSKKKIKTVNYAFNLETGFSGFKLPKDARIVSDTTTQNTGGLIDIQSGGESGETTIINHIKEIISHCPAVNKLLKDQKSYYKITTRLDMEEDEETITYGIIPYLLDFKGMLPLKKFNYFFGGTNEDVLEFEFNLDGLFRVLPNAIVRSTRNTKERDTSENDSAQQAKSRNAGAAGYATINPDQGKGNTDEEKLTPSVRRGHQDVSAFPTNKSKSNEFYKNNTTEAQRLHLNLTSHVESHVGSKLLEGGFTIIGDPNLILDEATIKALKELDPPAPLESAVNYVLFNIGIPTPEFPAIPETDPFIFNGYYGIRSLKSIWDEKGTFTQRLDVFWRSDLAIMARGAEKEPDKDAAKAFKPEQVDPGGESFTDETGKLHSSIQSPETLANKATGGVSDEVGAARDNYGNIKDSAVEDVTEAGKLRAGGPKPPGRSFDPATGLEIDPETGNVIDPRTGEVAPGGFEDDF